MFRKEKIPNFLTAGRFFLAALVVIFLSIPSKTNLYLSVTLYGLVAANLFLFSSFTDFLDGYLSRKWNCITTFGKIFDPLADKFLICGTMICLMCKGSLHTLVGIVLVARDVLMDLLVRPLLHFRGVEAEAIRSAKWKTATQMVGLTVILFFCSNKILSDGFWPPLQNSNWWNWLSHFPIFISSIFSVVSFCVYLKKLINSYRTPF